MWQKVKEGGEGWQRVEEGGKRWPKVAKGEKRWQGVARGGCQKLVKGGKRVVRGRQKVVWSG